MEPSAAAIFGSYDTVGRRGEERREGGGERERERLVKISFYTSST